MDTKFKATETKAPALRFSAAAEALLGNKAQIAPNALSQVTHAMRYQ